MRHPPAAECLEESHRRPFLCCVCFPLFFVATAVFPRKGLFCRWNRAARIFSRVLLNCILNDQDVHRAKVSHRILPRRSSRASRYATGLKWRGSLRANNYFFLGEIFNAALSCASLSSPHASGFPECIAS